MPSAYKTWGLTPHINKDFTKPNFHGLAAGPPGVTTEGFRIIRGRNPATDFCYVSQRGLQGRSGIIVKVRLGWEKSLMATDV